jgi:hypothetical protein
LLPLLVRPVPLASILAAGALLGFKAAAAKPLKVDLLSVPADVHVSER